ncbi:MAG: hypothetical protein JNJ53_07360 [Rhizobiales bacterium]|nr:hypothetical protein [Hyphomicrobiales bacterium]
MVSIDSLSKSFDRHRLFLESPYQSTLALDSDLIFRASIDPLWEPLEQSGVLLTRFYAPPFGVDGTRERPGFANRMAFLAGIRRLIDKDLYERTVRRLLVDRIDINIGVMGISRPTGDAFLADLASHLERGRPHAIPLLDEMLVVALAGKHQHRLVNEIWNCPADEFFRRTNLADARVIHYFAEGHAVHGIALGRNPNTWAGLKWRTQFDQAVSRVPLHRWSSYDPVLAR